MKKLNPKVFVKAAKRVYKKCPLNACAAIDHELLYVNSNVYRHEFEVLFKPKTKKRYDLWFGPFFRENQEARILALLLMAEIYK